jgi:hypothetical protein
VHRFCALRGRYEQFSQLLIIFKEIAKVFGEKHYI